MATILPYARPNPRPFQAPNLRVPLFCGVLPPIIGAVAFLVWFVDDRGLITFLLVVTAVALGLLLGSTGAVWVCVAGCSARLGTGEWTTWRATRREFLLLLLLLCNIPIAYAVGRAMIDWVLRLWW